MESMKIFKLWVLFFSPFVLIVLSNCAFRDFDNPVLKEHYNPPVIQINYPGNGTNIDGVVKVGLFVHDSSGMKSVRIYSPGVQDLEFYNNSSSKEMFINADLRFWNDGYKYIYISAKDSLDLESQAMVAVNVTVNTPQITLNVPSSGFSFTNVTNITSSGNAWVNSGIITTVELVRGDNKVFSATGTSNWFANIYMLPNTTNSFTVNATSDKGLIGNNWFQVVCDQQMPVLNIDYPKNGMSTPRSFNLQANAWDLLSGIDWIAFWVDTAQPYSSIYTNWSPSTGWWYSGLTNGIHKLYIQTKDRAGNKTAIVTNTFIADGSIPSLGIYYNFYSTNIAAPTISGFAEVDVPNTITKIEISKNGGAFQQVNMYNPGSSHVEWTNVSTSGLLMNSHNDIVIRAVSSANKTNSVHYHFILDNQPPNIQQFDPVDSFNIVNSGDFSLNATVRDNLSPMMYIAVYSRGAGMTAVIQSNDVRNSYQPDAYAWLMSTYSDFGGIYTNVLVAKDVAGNSITKTNFVYVYPHLFVNLSGSDTTGYGFARSPYKSLQKGIDRAKQLGVNNLVVFAGTYTMGNGLNTAGSGVVIDGFNNLTISGGWEWNGATVIHTNMTRLDGGYALNHVVEIMNSTDIKMNSFIIQKGKASAAPNNKGGGMYLNAVNYSVFTNIIFTNNSATGAQADGGGLYMFSCDGDTFYIAAVNNTANGGGGIAVNNCRWNYFYGYLLYNSAIYTGGGMQIYNGNGNNIYMNTALNSAQFGGGIALMNGYNDVIQNSARVQMNSAEYGGGVYVFSFNNFTAYGSISNNHASVGTAKLGGGIYMENSVYAYIPASIQNNTATAGGGIFMNNCNNNTITPILQYNNAGHSGGGMALSNSHNNFINGSMRYNIAGQNGGGFALVNSRYNIFDSMTVEYNYTTSLGADTGGGGGSFVNSSYNLINGGANIKYNASTNNGGGIAILNSAGNTNYGLIQNNKAYKSGGGVAIKYGSGHYFNCTIANNNSYDMTGGGGGGIAAFSVSALNIQGSVMMNNAYLKGGGMVIANCTNSYINAWVFKNTLSSANNNSMGGGGIYINEGKNNSFFGTILSNSAMGPMPCGGGIWVAGQNTINALIENNSASYGGGIYIWDNNVTVGGSSIVRNNSAAQFGGGIAVDNGPIGNSKIFGTVIGNSTIPVMALGSGIYLSGKNNTVQANIVNNSGIGSANGIFVTNSVGCKIMNCVITNNVTFHPIDLGGNNTGLMISNNIIAAHLLAGTYGIYENKPVSGHIIKDNKFKTGLIQYVYYDTVNGIISNPAALNIPANSQASMASGNIWW